MKRLTMSEFIIRAKKIHGDKFDYTKAVYTTCFEKLIITCPYHGDFEQSANSHLNGHGCELCKTELVARKKTLSTDLFIEKSVKQHGDRYDYSKSVYVTNTTPLTITCLKHGDFEQKPVNHLRGSGCFRCGLCSASNLKRSNNEKFISKAIKVHGSVYDYHKVDYMDAGTDIVIICKKHGAFKQLPSNHLRGSGCQLCSSNTGRSKIADSWLDCLNIAKREYPIKIAGKTIKVDGFENTTKTVYQFHGDFWHGNPVIYAPDDINAVSKKTMGELFTKTTQTDFAIEEAGYRLVTIWESDWRNINKKKEQSND